MFCKFPAISYRTEPCSICECLACCCALPSSSRSRPPTPPSCKHPPLQYSSAQTPSPVPQYHAHLHTPTPCTTAAQSRYHSAHHGLPHGSLEFRLLHLCHQHRLKCLLLLCLLVRIDTGRIKHHVLLDNMRQFHGPDVDHHHLNGPIHEHLGDLFELMQKRPVMRIEIRKLVHLTFEFRSHEQSLALVEIHKPRPLSNQSHEICRLLVHGFHSLDDTLRHVLDGGIIEDVVTVQFHVYPPYHVLKRLVQSRNVSLKF